MSAAQDPTSVARALFDAFGRRDVAALKALLAEDAEWRVPGGSLLAGVHRGPDAILAYLGSVGQLSGGTYRAQVLDVLGSAERAAVWVATSGRREGRTLGGTYLLLLKVRDGRVQTARLFPEDLPAFDAFWS